VTVISPAKGIKTIGELVAAAKSRSLTYTPPPAWAAPLIGPRSVCA
jgi:hypothetical protein